MTGTNPRRQLEQPTRSEREIKLEQALRKAARALEIAADWVKDNKNADKVIRAHAKQARAALKNAPRDPR